MISQTFCTKVKFDHLLYCCNIFSVKGKNIRYQIRGKHIKMFKKLNVIFNLVCGLFFHIKQFFKTFSIVL